MDVADTILLVARMGDRSVAPAFGASAVGRRVTALLAVPKTAGSLAGPLTAALVLAIAVLASSSHVHHFAESALSLLTR